jgi:hypothetical protein
MVHMAVPDLGKSLPILIGVRHIVEVFPDPKKQSHARIQTSHNQMLIDESFEQVNQLIRAAEAPGR